MTQDSKPKIRVSVVLWWIYVLAVLVVLAIVAQRVYPALATEYRLTWFESFCVALLPAFACTIPGFFLRRLRLGQMAVTFIAVVVGGVISLIVAKFAFEKKITDEANRLSAETNSMFTRVSAPLAAPTPPPAPAVTLSPALTPTPSITPTPEATPTPTVAGARPAGATPTPTPTPIPTLPPYDAAEVKTQLTATGNFELDALRAEYQRDVSAAGSARLLNPERLATDRSMEAGRKALEQLNALNDQFQTKERDWVEAQVPRLDTLYIPELERAAMKKGFFTSATRGRGYVDNFWNAEKKFLNEVNNIFTMLKDSKAWGVADGKFTFNDAGFASDLNVHLIKLQALGADRAQTQVESQTALKQTLVEMFAAGAAAAAAAPVETPTPTSGAPASPAPATSPAPALTPAPAMLPAPTPTPAPAVR